MEKIKSGFEFIVSSYKRTAAVLAVAALTLAIPFTISFLSQRQDIRQRAYNKDDFVERVPPCAPTGDVKQNEIINESDFEEIEEIIEEDEKKAKKIAEGESVKEETDPEKIAANQAKRARADVNGDQQVTSGDVKLVAQFLLNQTETFPGCLTEVGVALDTPAPSQDSPPPPTFCPGIPDCLPGQTLIHGDPEPGSANQCPIYQCTGTNTCGDGVCQNIVCLSLNCPIAESIDNCPKDCSPTPTSVRETCESCLKKGFSSLCQSDIVRQGPNGEALLDPPTCGNFADGLHCRSCQPTPTTVPNETYLKLAFKLTGIGVGSSSAGLTSAPQRPRRNFEVVILNSQNQPVLTTKGWASYYAGTDSVTSPGVYTGGVTLGTDFPTGSYLVKVRMDNTLWKAVPGIQNITGGGNNSISTPVSLITGDVNGDNVINLLDYNLFLSCLGGKCPESVPVYSDLDNYTVEGSPSGTTITCVPRPACLDASPPCLPPEPARGWCPFKSLQKALFDFNDDGIVDEVDLNILYFAFSKRQGD